MVDQNFGSTRILWVVLNGCNGGKMLIRVSSISEYVYCPVKMYLSYTQDREIKTPEMIAGKLSHEIRRGFQELIKQNLWSVKKDLGLDEISASLFENAPSLIRNTIERRCKIEGIDFTEVESVYEKLKDELKLESCIIALKIKNILRETGKTGAEVVDMLFPPSLLEYPIEDRKLNLSGKVDKIEIIDGIYYPIEIKAGRFPIRGVWESDALQVAAYAVLIEQEFDTEVLVGFVDYLKINERRPVVVNSKLRGKLFDVLDDINAMFHDEHTPEPTSNIKKCERCGYMEFCER